MTETVYTDETADYYDAALTYWRAVKADGENSAAAALAGMRMAARAVEAKQAGVTGGEINLLNATAKVMVNRERAE